MPRLTAADYTARHDWVRRFWDSYPLVFGVLSPRQQWQVHRFYQSRSDAGDGALLEVRRRLTAAEPALPHVASKAYLRLRTCFRIADDYAGEDEMAFRRAIGQLARRRSVKGVWVTAVARPEPDLVALAQVIASLVDDLAA